MRRSFLLLIALSVLLLAAAIAVASNDVPGSPEDPVVSKSYVDQRTSFLPVMLGEGQSLIGGAGAEIILRSGEATAIDNGENGVSNLTAGTDLMTGAQVGTNNLLLVPRADGRGIKALVDETWVMVRGEYEIIH